MDWKIWFLLIIYDFSIALLNSNTMDFISCGQRRTWQGVWIAETRDTFVSVQLVTAVKQFACFTFFLLNLLSFSLPVSNYHAQEEHPLTIRRKK